MFVRHHCRMDCIQSQEHELDHFNDNASWGFIEQKGDPYRLHRLLDCYNMPLNIWDVLICRGCVEVLFSWHHLYKFFELYIHVICFYVHPVYIINLVNIF